MKIELSRLQELMVDLLNKRLHCEFTHLTICEAYQRVYQIEDNHSRNTAFGYLSALLDLNLLLDKERTKGEKKCKKRKKA
jgi:hypothetical protein